MEFSCFISVRCCGRRQNTKLKIYSRDYGTRVMTDAMRRGFPAKLLDCGHCRFGKLNKAETSIIRKQVMAISMTKW